MSPSSLGATVRSSRGSGAGPACPACVLAAVLLAGAAAADATSAKPADAAERAERKFREAEEAYGRGDDRAAERLFLEARALRPLPIIALNLAIVYIELGRPADALGELDRFLDETRGNTEATPEQRSRAARLIDEHRGTVGTVEIQSDTPDAEVIVDGKKREGVPAGRPLRLTPGSHEVVVSRRDGGATSRRDVTLSAGERIQLAVRLAGEPATGSGWAPSPPGTAPAPPRPAGLVPSPLAQPTQAPPSGPEAPEPSPSLWRRQWFWGAVGAVVGAAVMAGIVLARRSDQFCVACGDRRFPVSP